MSTPPKMCDNPCETCAKEGLPILLARYALMPTETGAPKLNGTLDDPDLGKVPLGQGAHYGLRLLRSGYVYVYDEARKHFDEYFVTADGFLSKMPPRIWALKQQHQPATEFRCARNGAAPLAGVITIRNPKYATKVWIAFSNAEWTKALFDKHQDAAYRAKHMRCITIAGGKVASQPGTAPIEEVKQHLPEFKMEQTSATKAFAKFSPHSYNGRQHAADSLLKAIQQTRPQGGSAIVALHDPTALVQEIAGLMVLRKGTYMERPDIAKPLFAASAIEALEAQVKAQARLSEMVEGEAQAEEAENTSADWNPSAAQAGVPHSNPWAAQKIRASITPENLEAIAKRRWKTYTHTVRGDGAARFDEIGAKAWLKKHRAEFQTFDATYILPLARAHVAWMKSDCMAQHMQCTHDPADASSGAAFTAGLCAAMEHTWDILPCYEQYLAWIKEGGSASQNLVMRAVALNLDTLAEAINKADKPSLESRAFPTDAVFGGLTKHFERLSDEAKRVHAKLMAGLSGAGIKYWDEFQTGKVSPAFAAAMSGASGKQIVRLPLLGTRSQLIEAYVTQISRLNPNMVMNQNQLRQAVAAQTRLMQLQGIKLDQTRKLGWFVLLDADAGRTVFGQAKATGLSGQALADELVKAAMRSPQAVRDLERNAIDTMSRAAKHAWTATSLGGILMAWNYTKLEEDFTNGMSHELVEAQYKLWAGRGAVGGFVSETLGKLLNAVSETKLKNAMGLNLAKVGQVLMKWGGRISVVSGVFVGLWDTGKAWGEYEKGDLALATAYAVGGGAATVLAIYSFYVASLGPIGWTLLAMVLLITLWVESNKDNKLQEWLSRSHFGAAPPADKYADHARQLSEYELATK